MPNILTYLKLGAALIVVAVLVGGYTYFRHIQKEAALVPTLISQQKLFDARAEDLSTKLAATNKDRDELERTLTAFQAQKARLLEELAKEGSHASAANNPACMPSGADRSVRNETLGRLTGAGQASDPNNLPDGTGRTY